MLNTAVNEVGEYLRAAAPTGGDRRRRAGRRIWLRSIAGRAQSRHPALQSGVFLLAQVEKAKVTNLARWWWRNTPGSVLGDLAVAHSAGCENYRPRNATVRAAC